MALTLTLRNDLTQKQHDILRSPSHFQILKGPAGTSKSYLALAKGFKALIKGDVEQIVVIRSPVEIRKIGFLPGSEQEKMDVYAEPYVHLLNQLSPKQNFRALRSAKLVDFMGTSYLRGQTFDESFIIVDEFQNMSKHELETIVTRVGDGSRMILCGDTDGQSDLPKWEQGEYEEVLATLEAMPDFETWQFGVEDIVRSAFVRRYYQAKEGLFETPEFLKKTG